MYSASIQTKTSSHSEQTKYSRGLILKITPLLIGAQDSNLHLFGSEHRYRTYYQGKKKITLASMEQNRNINDELNSLEVKFFKHHC